MFDEMLLLKLQYKIHFFKWYKAWASLADNKLLQTKTDILASFILLAYLTSILDNYFDARIQGAQIFILSR